MEWLPVKTSNNRYAKRYLISNKGDIRSLTKHKMMTPNLVGGYYYNTLNDGTQCKTYQNHRLVAEHFVPNATGGTVIDHIDNNPLNNDYKNLQWISHPVNVKLSYDRDNRDPSGSVRILQIDEQGKVLNTFPSIKAASRQTGVDTSGISMCCSGYRGRKTAGGFAWKYRRQSEQQSDTPTLLFVETIPMYENYGITEEGVVVNLTTNRVKKPYLTGKGYHKVNLWKDNKETTQYIHKLVALTYLPNPEDLPLAHHIDGDKTNNNVTNLVWATYTDVMNNRVANAM